MVKKSVINLLVYIPDVVKLFKHSSPKRSFPTLINSNINGMKLINIIKLLTFTSLTNATEAPSLFADTHWFPPNPFRN